MTSTDRSKKSKLLLGGVAIVIATLFFFRNQLFRIHPTHPLQIEAVQTENEPNLTTQPATSLSGATTSIAQSPAPTLTQYSAQTQTLMRTLNEILSSKNDNDPRLDQDFRQLTPEAKAALREKYLTLPKEDRNARGTIALLIGREISDSNDLGFLKEILSEAPCLSLEDCNKENHFPTGHDAHQEVGLEVTLAYPQMSTLYWLEKFASTPSGLRAEALSAIQAGKSSQIPLVRRKAQELEKKLRSTQGSSI